jgi:hypothetical protein
MAPPNIYGNETKTLYIFIDESGNFDFSPKGSKYFILTAVSTLTPLKGRGELLRRANALKYAQMAEGVKNAECYHFHATEDRQEVRNSVFELIKNLTDTEVDAICVQKNKTNPSLYIDYKTSFGKKRRDGSRTESVKTVHSPERFYGKVAEMLLQYIFRRYEGKDGVERIVVVMGSLWHSTRRDGVLKTLKHYLKNNFGKPFQIFFIPTSADINCQIADYCCWAISVGYERREFRPWREIKPLVKSRFNVFARGTTEYYSYEK